MTTYQRAVFLLFDGARWDVFQRLMDADDLPNIRARLAPDGRVHRAVAAFPTVSGPAHLPFMTGCFPGTLGAPGDCWFDRPMLALRKSVRLSVRSYRTPSRVSDLDRDLEPFTPTLAAAWPDTKYVFAWYTRGSPDSALLTRWPRISSLVRGALARDPLRCDADAEAALNRAIDSGASFVFSVFPSPDLASRRFGPTSDPALAACRGMDAVIGRLFDHLARRGEADRTLVVLSADHGLSATQGHFALDRAVQSVFGRTLTYRPWPALPREFDAVVMPSGDGMANVYFRGDGWDLGRPDAERFRAFAMGLLSNEAVDHVAWRTGDGWLRVTGRGGAARMRDAPGGLIYVAEGTDPFGYGPLPALMDRETALHCTEDTPYPDAPVALLTWARSPRAGDLLVTARLGFDLRDVSRARPPLATGGGLHARHAHVPVLCNAPLSDGPMRTVDLYPTMVALTGRTLPPGVEGVSRAK
jgi:hypothetical protein